jgi:hypothetical protein
LYRYSKVCSYVIGKLNLEMGDGVKPEDLVWAVQVVKSVDP